MHADIEKCIHHQSSASREVPNYKFMFSLVVLCVCFDSVSHKQNNPSLCKCKASLQVCTQTAN